MRSECVAFETDLSAYVDGELDTAARARLDAHLARCDTCRTEVKELRHVGQALRRWDAEETRYAQSTGFRNRVYARLGVGGVATPTEEARAWRRAAWAAAAGAAFVCFGAWSMTHGPWRRAPDGETNLADLEWRVAELESRVSGRIAQPTPEAPRAPDAEPATAVRRLSDVPPLPVRPPREELRAMDDTVGNWVGDHVVVHEEAVSAYNDFLLESSRLTIDEGFKLLKDRASASGGTTQAPPPVGPLARFLENVSVADVAAPPFEGVRVWPIEISSSASPLRGARVLALEEAIRSGIAKLTEGEGSGSVVANNTDVQGRPVLLLAGDVLRGGRRDRVLRQDALLWPGPDRRISLPVWGAGDERKNTTYRSFTRSALLSPLQIRAVLEAGRANPYVGQGDFDQAVELAMTQLASKGVGSLENLRSNDHLDGEVLRYVNEFRKRLDRPNVVGFAVSVGSEVIAAELCGDPETFGLLRERLVRSHVYYALVRPHSSSAAPPPPRSAVEAMLRTAARGVYDEPPDDGTPTAFRSLDGRVFGSGLLDGFRIVHATVFAGPLVTGSGGVGGLGRTPGGKTPPTAPGESGGPASGPDRAGGSGQGGVDSR